MAKPKKVYVCQACGSSSHRWQGQCADCAEWNTLVAETYAPGKVINLLSIGSAQQVMLEVRFSDRRCEETFRRRRQN